MPTVWLTVVLHADGHAAVPKPAGAVEVDPVGRFSLPNCDPRGDPAGNWPCLGPLLDDAARDAYRDRTRRLDTELAAADRAGDSAAAERIHNERQALAGELRRATGLADRRRRTSADAERARVNVTRTLRPAIGRIALAAPIARAHLDPSIRTGTLCRYQPAPGGPDRWHT